MRVLAVDLAAKYSAACLMDQHAQVHWQCDSWGRTESGFISAITYQWQYRQEPPDVLVIEDLPHRLPFSSLVKRVARIQGRIVDRMDSYGLEDAVLFVPPALWRKHFDGLERGTGADAVVAVAGRLGYAPPDLSDRIVGGKDRATAKKVRTDYCAAFLIACWAIATVTETGSFDLPGTSRYAA